MATGKYFLFGRVVYSLPLMKAYKKVLADVLADKQNVHEVRSGLVSASS